jgi:hypothetical protein
VLIQEKKTFNTTLAQVHRQEKHTHASINSVAHIHNSDQQHHLKTGEQVCTTYTLNPQSSPQFRRVTEKDVT